jgi:hypothetical protein
MLESEAKLRNKLLKQQCKLEKKQQKAKPGKSAIEGSATPSRYVRFAEFIKGILYLVLAVSMIAAVLLDESGLILALEEIIDSLIIATLGKVLIGIIAVALFINGLKNPGILK